jgi:hypothetical protein
MRNENAGQIRIIEAVFAVFVIFSAFAVTANLPATQNTSRSGDLSSVGLQVLMKLDSDGSLGRNLDQGNWTVLRECLNLALPAGISFNMTVYDEQMHEVNTAVISNGGFGSQEVSFTEYVCASRGLTLNCYVIQLYLAVTQ